MCRLELGSRVGWVPQLRGPWGRVLQEGQAAAGTALQSHHLVGMEMAPEGRWVWLLRSFFGCFGCFLFASLRSFLPICDILVGYSRCRDCPRTRESLLKLYIRTLFLKCLSTVFNLYFCPISFSWKSFNSISKRNWWEQILLLTLTNACSDTFWDKWIYNLMSADCTWLSALHRANTIAALVRNYSWARDPVLSVAPCAVCGRAGQAKGPLLSVQPNANTL